MSVVSNQGQGLKPLTHARILAIALPIMLSNASVPLVGLSDTFVMGRLGGQGLIGGVGFAVTVLTMVFWFFNFFRHSTTAYMAQALGRGDQDEQSLIVWRNGLAAAVIGVLLLALQWPIAEVGFWLMHSQTELVNQTARAYYDIRIWSAPFVLANYVVMGVLIARQRSGAVLITQLALNLSNIGLNILLGLELGWGVHGVAWASVFSTFLATAIGLWFLFGEGFVRRRLPSATQFFDFLYWRRAAGNARDLAIRVIFLELAFAIFERRMDAYGPTTLDAAIALAQLINVTAFFIDGFAFATESYVGESIGAKKRRRFWRAFWMTTLWANVAAVMLALFLWVFGETLLLHISGSAVLTERGMHFMLWVVIMPLISVWAYQLDGAYIGASETIEMRNQMLLSFGVYLLVMLVAEPMMGVHGLWLAFAMFNATRGVTLFWRMPALERRAGLLAAPR